VTIRFSLRRPYTAKQSTDKFLQNEANIAAVGKMHDKASYHAVLQVMKCNKE